VKKRVRLTRMDYGPVYGVGEKSGHGKKESSICKESLPPTAFSLHAIILMAAYIDARWNKYLVSVL
jgi:hypothetical protein